MIDIDAYYRKYGPMVYRQCFRILRNEENALDAMQDVFVQVLRRQKTITHKAPSSLLYTIATNVSLNWLRKEKRKAETADDQILLSIAGYDDHVGRTEDRTFLDGIFAREKESTKTIAVLHYMERLTLKETAEQMEMSVSGIRKRLRKLRENVEELREV